MKALFYRILLLTGWLAGLGLTASAQNVPNNGLDTWAVRSGLDAPTNWQTTDNILAALYGVPAAAINTGTVTKSTDVHGGTYAARLATTAYTNSSGTTVFPGLLLLGNRVLADTATGNFSSGLPYTARPTQLQFYYKLTGGGATTDSPGAQVVLTRTTNGVTQLVGRGSLVLTPAATYTQVTVPIQYSASVQPDSITLFFASGNVQKLIAGTSLLVDDITLSGGVLAVRADASIQEQLTVSPNPSPAGRFQLSAPDAPALASAPYTILDVTGRVVAQQPALAVPSSTRELNLSSLSAGVYILRLDTKQGMVVRQLAIK